MDSDNIEARPKKRHPALRVAMFIIKFGIAGGIIYWLLSRDFHRFVESVSNVRTGWLAIAAALIFLQMAACAYRWQILLRSQGIKMPFHETLSLYLQGFFFSLAIPGGSVGGDLVKAGIIAARAPAGKKFEGVLSIAADRITGMVALFGLAVAFSPLLMEFMGKLDPAMKTAFLFLVCISVGGLCAAAAFPFHDLLFKLKPVKTLSDKADVLSKGAVSKMLDVVRLYKTKWKAVLMAIAVSAVIANPFQIAALYCLVIGVSGTAPDIAATSISMLFGGSAAAIPLTPGGIGTRDAVCKAGLIAGGVDPVSAIAAPLLFTTIFVCISLFGGALFAFDSFFRHEAVAQKEEGIPS